MKDLFLLLFLLPSLPAQAHNGKIALAYPVEGIVIDGDLSEWPEGIRIYPIREMVEGYGYGRTDLNGMDLDTSTDLSPEFMVGYSLEEQLIYVAVRVRDDRIETNVGDDRGNDACEVFLDAQYGSLPFRYVMCPQDGSYWPNGSNPSLTQFLLGYQLSVDQTRSRGAVARWGDVTVYEWALQPLGTSLRDSLALRPGMVMGFDVMAVDKDHRQDTPVGVAWTPVPRGRVEPHFKEQVKVNSPLMLGDLILLEKGMEWDNIWSLMDEALHARRLNVRKALDDIRIYKNVTVVSTAILLAFALLHLVLFLFYPRSQANVYYALFTSCLAVVVFNELDLRYRLHTLIEIVLLGSGLRFFYTIFYPRLPRQFWLLIAILIGGEVWGLVRSVFYNDRVWVYVFNVLTLGFIVEVLRVVFVALWQHKEGAWVIGIGTVLMMLCSGYMVLEALWPGHSYSAVLAAVFTHHLFVLYCGILSLAISMSLYLAREFAQTNKNLGIQLVQVQKLSEEALVQERRIRDEETQRKLLESELQTAHDMQMSLMPTEGPHIQGFDISGRCLPASHVGGDFFQYFQQNGTLTISLADVTGHAMEAAVPAMMFSGVLKTEMQYGHPIEDLFVNLNHILHGTLDKRTFVCFTIGELDPATHVLRISNCGCPYPYHYKAASDEIVELPMDAYPLGIHPDSTYSVIEARLAPNDRIVFCSDGIVEAANVQEEIFGFEQMAKMIHAGCSEGLSAEGLIDHLIGAVQMFSGDAPQGDDMTVVVLRVEG